MRGSVLNRAFLSSQGTSLLKQPTNSEIMGARARSGGSPYNRPNGEASPEMGTFVRLEVYVKG